MAGMISLINNHIDHKGIRLSGYGLSVGNYVKGPGYPDWSRTEKLTGNASSDAEYRDYNGDGRQAIFSLLTNLDDAGHQSFGLRMAPLTFNQETNAIQINRFEISQRSVHGDSKVFSLPDNKRVVEVVWLLACGVIGLSGLGRRRTV